MAPQSKWVKLVPFIILTFFSCALVLAQVQTVPGAQFGKVVALGGEPSDIEIDEARSRLYVVNSGANRVAVYNYQTESVEDYIGVGTFPSAAAISMDGRFLYVANVQSASISIVDLESLRVTKTVPLPARPEGVEVGFDGRVLISTQGSGLNNAQNTLLVFDPTQDLSSQLIAVASPPPVSTPTPLPPIFVGRPSTPFAGRLVRTPDGQFIVGMVAINQTATAAQTTLFVYEAASGTVLRNRTVTGQSTVLAMSPDGTKFMAGSTLYDIANLNVLAQLSTANYPFFVTLQGNPAINLQNNFGGSAFSTDGLQVFGAFNVQTGAPNTRPLSDAMVVASAQHLGVRLGIRLPESVLGKMISTSDGASVFASSESGIIHLPMATLYDNPILVPDTTQVFLAVDPCNKGIARAAVRVNNLGSGKLSYTVPVVTTALVTEVTSGLAPSTVNFVMEPGRSGVIRQAGTNVFTGAGSGGGAPINVNLNSREAINFPNVIRVYMNFRNADQRGVLFPVPTTLNNGEGLWDLLLDEPRQRVYIANSGYNRVEVFDIRRQRFVEPIEVGQLPHSMAMSLDGSSLYVGNTGGESISIVDLDARRVVGNVQFPALPRPGNQAVVRPLSLGMSLSGLQFIMSNGGLWRVVGDTAIPRPASSVISPTTATTTLAAPAQYSFASTPGGEYLVALAGNGNAYLYDALADAYTVGRTINQAPIQSYYGPAVGAPRGSFFLVNGLILSPSLSVLGGAERPGVVQTGPSPGPGQPPTQTIVSGGQRHVAAVYPVSETQFVRMTLPVRNTITTATRDDARPTLELVDIRTGAESVVAIAPDNPPSVALGAQRLYVPARQLAVDTKNNAYVVSLSGLAVVPLQTGGPVERPAIAGGGRGILNANNGTANFGPGSFITVSGTNLAVAATADEVPLPTVMGGSCVTLSDVPLPLLQTSTGQITAQIPDNLRPGLYIAQIRNLASATQSDSVLVTVQRPQ
ncbi:MAG: beta-propeller fold lactonase family protein [Bryobacterales bacterium]|nr:beta-propeller fold lactonase family protein [Bryobacterales bacterium]